MPIVCDNGICFISRCWKGRYESFKPTLGYAWGNNSANQLGVGHSSFALSAPKELRFPRFIRRLAMGWYHALALTPLGGMYSWGSNEDGRLGTGTVAHLDGPQRLDVPPLLDVAAGWHHSLVVTREGRVLSWGRLPCSVAVSVPRAVGGELERFCVRRVAAGSDISLALTHCGKIFAWGQNAHGQLGDGTAEPRESPVRTGGHLRAQHFTAISTHYAHALALTERGDVYAWGRGDGRLGIGTKTGDMYNPIRLAFGRGTVIVDIAAGARHNLAVDEDGRIFAWGHNQACECAQPNSYGTLIMPTVVELLPSVPFARVAAGCATSFALSREGVLYAWGRNHSGSLGLVRGDSDGSDDGDDDICLWPNRVPIPRSTALCLEARQFSCMTWVGE